MGEGKCICSEIKAGPLTGHMISKIGCPVHDPSTRLCVIPVSNCDFGDDISRDLNADRVPEATREAAPNDAPPPCAPPQSLSNVRGGASFSGVLGERPSGRVWRVEYDPALHMVAIAGLGIGFGLNHTDARLLYLELGDAINVRRAGA